jgi:galactarate dehydratase
VRSGTAEAESAKPLESFHLVLDVADGRRPPWCDRWGLHNARAVFNPAPIT